MNCPVCTNEMVKASATDFGAEYDYCRTCKKELSEMGTPTAIPGCAFGCDEAEGTISSRCSIHGCGPIDESTFTVNHSPTPGPCTASQKESTHHWTSTMPGTRCGCHAFERDYRGMPIEVILDPADPDYNMPPGAFNMSAGYDAGKTKPPVTLTPYGKPLCAGSELTFDDKVKKATRVQELLTRGFAKKKSNTSNSPDDSL